MNLGRHGLVLVVIALAGLLRALFWVVATEVWNPVDEAHHYSYVASLAEGDGIPEVGHDRVPIEVLEVEKASPTLWQRGSPHTADLDDPWWSKEAAQYEGVQPPLYYLLLTPAYWVSRPFGVVTAVYVMRVATALIALAAVPLAWLLAKELLPKWPVAWLATPALLVAINGFNSNLASITNDALVVPLSTAAMVAAARFVRRPTHPRAAVTGVLVGLAFLTKTTTIGLLPLLALAFLGVLVSRRVATLRMATSAVVAGGATFLVVSPWLVWNLVTYGAPTAATATADITGSLMTTEAPGLGTVWSHWGIALAAFWDFQLRHQREATYATVLGWATVTAFVAGCIAALRRRDRRLLGGLAWAAAALPMAFVGMEVIVFGVFGGTGQAQGRHLYLALAPICVVIAGGAIVALGDRWGSVAVAGVIAAALLVEQGQARFYSQYAYTSGILEPDLAPVVDQSLSEGVVTTGGIRVDPPCPAHAVALAVIGTVPEWLPVHAPTGETVARHAGMQTTDFDAVFNQSQAKLEVYVLERPESERFEMLPPAPLALGAADHDVEPRLGLLDGVGDPVARLYCPVPEPAELRFEQLYRPLHPRQVSYGFLQGGPRAWAAGGVVAFVIMLLAAVRRQVPGRNSRDH